MLVSKTSRFKKSFIFILITGLLVVTGFVSWNIYKYRLVKGKAKDAVYEKSKGLYTLHYDDIKLDEVAGYLYVTNLSIVPDTALYKKMVNDKTNPPLLLWLTIPELKVSGIKTPKALLAKELVGNRIDINHPLINFYYAKSRPDTSSAKVKQEMYRQILGSLELIKVDTVNIIHASLAFTDIKNDKKMIEASSISVLLSDILIDSLHSNDTARFFFAKKVHLSAEKGLIKNKQGTYIYHVNGIDFNSATRNFSIAALQIEPQLKEAEFASFSRLQKDRFNFTFNNVSLRNIKLTLLMQAWVVADTLLIEQSNFKIYRDLSYPRDTKNRIGTYPQQLLAELPVPVSLKAMIVKDAFIEYKEKNPKSDYSGRVQFVHASATIKNITNLATEIKQDNNCVLNFTARFMDMAPVQAKIIMRLDDAEGRFSVIGSISAFEAPKLNVLLEPMALARIDRGRVNKVSFNLACHNYGSDGKLVMLYEDLKITLLRKDSTEDRLRKKGLASFVANIVVKNANPLRKQDIREAEVHYKRDTNRSFFNLIWKSIFTGAKETVGIK